MNYNYKQAFALGLIAPGMLFADSGDWEVLYEGTVNAKIGLYELYPESTIQIPSPVNGQVYRITVDGVTSILTAEMVSSTGNSNIGVVGTPPWLTYHLIGGYWMMYFEGEGTHTVKIERKV